MRREINLEVGIPKLLPPLRSFDDSDDACSINFAKDGEPREHLFGLLQQHTINFVKAFEPREILISLRQTVYAQTLLHYLSRVSHLKESQGHRNRTGRSKQPGARSSEQFNKLVYCILHR